ncbi:hypothetical protein [Ancylobacter terrae]|uniref:hypothetical protein n=1 Tax=Ancylobacter sp. sgz301288 TaxID=3342077 RepID=UPI00385AE6C3
MKNLVYFATIVVALLIGIALFVLSKNEVPAMIGLPLLAIGAVIVLIILLCTMSVVFASYGLQDKSQALALPEGSIRAVIALMLIVLFAILSIYLFGSLSGGPRTSLGVLDEAVVGQLKERFGTGVMALPVAGDKGKFTVWLSEPISAEGVDFARQLLVLVGTLVTSISSFYFGSKTANEAVERATAPSAPVVELLDPTGYARGSGPQPFLLKGRNLGNVFGASIALGGRQVAASGIDASVPGELRFTLEVPEGEPDGDWALTLADGKLGLQPTGRTIAISA